MISPACDVRIRLPMTCGVRFGFGPSSRTSRAWPRLLWRGLVASAASSAGVPEAVPTTKLYAPRCVDPRGAGFALPVTGAALGSDLQRFVDKGEQASLGHEADHLAHALARREEQERRQGHHPVSSLGHGV